MRISLADMVPDFEVREEMELDASRVGMPTSS